MIALSPTVCLLNRLLSHLLIPMKQGDAFTGPRLKNMTPRETALNYSFVHLCSFDREILAQCSWLQVGAYRQSVRSLGGRICVGHLDGELSCVGV